MDLSPLIEKIRRQFAEVETSLSDPATVADRELFISKSREHQRLNLLLQTWDELDDARKQLDDNKAMLAEETDEEFREMINDDVAKLEKKIEELDKKVLVQILPPGENDSRNTIVEIRPAAG